MALTDAHGNITATYEYDEWGNVISRTGNIDTPFGYAGQHGYVYDKGTGLYFLKSRYYDPATGRFTSRDRFKGFENRPASQNPYTYCENDPVNKVDPEGYYANWVIGAAMGALSAYAVYWLEWRLGLRYWNWGHLAATVSLGALAGAWGGYWSNLARAARLANDIGLLRLATYFRYYSKLKFMVIQSLNKRNYKRMGWLQWAREMFSFDLLYR